MSIEISNLNAVYNAGLPYEVHALTDIDLTIHDGEFVGLAGHTGSGKSTLIQHINGLLKPTSGTIKVNGEDIHAEGYNLRLLRTRVGLVFQYPEHQLFEADVLSDVAFGPKNQGLTKEEAAEKAKEALALVGMDESFYGLSPFELSGGQKRRVAIAGMLAMDPEVLILDEPTAGLDPMGRDEILGELKKLHEEKHLTVILVSHSMEDLGQYAERIVVMSGGKVVMDGTPKEVFSHSEELTAIGLDVPQVTSVCRMLADAGWPVENNVTTVEEAKRQILAALGKALPEEEGAHVS